MGLAKRKLGVVAVDDQAIDASKMTVREYAMACIELGVKDYHAASEHTGHAEPMFFFMRRLKVHPKLVKQTPEYAAGVFQKLYSQEPWFREQCDGCEWLNSVDDLIAYVLKRWDGIRTLPDVTPWEVGFDAAMSQRALIVPEQVLAYVEKPGMYDIGPALWESRPVAYSFPWDTVIPPSYGLFVAATWHAYEVLLLNTNRGTTPELIVGTDHVASIFSRRHPISGKTISAYRDRLAATRAIVRVAKTAKAGPAFRYHVNQLELLRTIHGLKHQARRMADALGNVDID